MKRNKCHFHELKIYICLFRTNTRFKKTQYIKSLWIPIEFGWQVNNHFKNRFKSPNLSRYVSGINSLSSALLLFCHRCMSSGPCNPLPTNNVWNPQFLPNSISVLALSPIIKVRSGFVMPSFNIELQIAGFGFPKFNTFRYEQASMARAIGETPGIMKLLNFDGTRSSMHVAKNRQFGSFK